MQALQTDLQVKVLPYVRCKSCKLKFIMMVKWHVDHRTKRILISKLHFHLPCETYSTIRHKMAAVYSVYTIENFRHKSSQCCEKDTKNSKYNHSLSAEISYSLEQQSQTLIIHEIKWKFRNLRQMVHNFKQ